MGQFVWRLFVWMLALVFIASALLVLSGIALLWLLRSLWARLTGQPVAPMRMYATGWKDVARTVDRFSQRPRATSSTVEVADITDVEVKKVSPP
ncbi:MAG: hypothetical protein NTZ15_14085 [Burkholderiales bacterium]|nr:hypothetical protein [Burkholderiales bacterium]